MSNIRIAHNKDNPYVLTNKKTLEIETLSWEAKGLWSYLLSRPDDWITNVKHLASNFPGGRDRVRRILKELQEHKLCHYIQERTTDKNGKFAWGRGNYIIFETQCLFQKYFTETCFKGPENEGPQNTDPYLDTEKKLSNESSSNACAKLPKKAAAAPKKSLKEILLKKLSPRDVERALIYLETLNQKKLGSIVSISGFLIRAVKENWDEESYEIPGETNQEYAAKVSKLLKMHKTTIKTTNAKTYIEFYDGMWNKTLAYDMSRATFKAQIKSLLCRADLLKEIGNELNLGDET